MAEVSRLWLPVRIPIRDDTHAVVAAQQGRSLAAQLGFTLVEQTAFSTAILEIARNIVKYAGGGDITLQVVQDGDRAGIVVLACDEGPGIEDIELALKDGFSTGKSLGLGLPGAKRLMDVFEIASRPGHGTTVAMQKWKRPTSH
ncbi:MAG: anti-sigma regulatory factor [Chloroflexi bacterium]|nr:anti-sigma regulatory factor [Chloroflexota bacterium]